MPLSTAVADQCHGQWHIDLLKAPKERPYDTLFGYSCLCCAVYRQRKELLEITGEPYICFGGLCPLGPLRNPQGPSWLAIESCLCPCWSLAANRYIIQTRFNKADTLADKWLLTFTCLCTTLVGFVQYIKEVPALDNCVCCAISAVSGCMYAQQQAEIAGIKQKGYYGPTDSIYDVLPPVQQEMIQLGKPMGAGKPVADTIGADGVIPTPDASKTIFDAPAGAKDMDASKRRIAPLFSFCRFSKCMGQAVL